MIIAIGEFVFEEVCRMISARKIGQFGIERMEINLSPAQCVQKDLREVFKSIMDKYQIPYDMINLEITETAAVHSTEYLQQDMLAMNKDGIHFSLDDYGRGLSNVNYLVTFPFSIVKLDKELVWAAEKQENARVALRHIVKMMKELQLEIVAEGVETEAQVDMLREMDCDYMQGYLYAKPMPEDDFLSFIQAHQK